MKERTTQTKKKKAVSHVYADHKCTARIGRIVRFPMPGQHDDYIAFYKNRIVGDRKSSKIAELDIADAHGKNIFVCDC